MTWTNEHKVAYVKLVEIAAGTFNTKVDRRIIKLHLKYLKQYHPNQVLSAMERIIAMESRFPWPNLVIEHITGKDENHGLRAWNVVMDALRQVGTYQSIRFHDPVINAVLRQLVGTWADMRQYDDGKKSLTWLGKDFCKLYDDMIRTGEVPHVSHLPGVNEIENTQRGYVDHVAPPVPFGPYCPYPALKTREEPKAIAANEKIKRLVENVT